MTWSLVLFVLGAGTLGLAIREWRTPNGGSPGVVLTLGVVTTLAWITALSNGHPGTELVLGMLAALIWVYVIFKAYAR